MERAGAARDTGENAMVTKTIDISEARSRLPELLGLALAGTEVIIVAGDRPLAKLSPLEIGMARRTAGLDDGASWISDDFDDPLPDDFWSGKNDPLAR
jgi:antitoxin (DNA-binding transcriptional repressor) of toxin-antitoxin stability system